MDTIRDRRPNKHIPTPEDYETPLTRSALLEANKRFRAYGVPGAVPGSNRDKADRIVKDVTRERYKRHKISGQDFESVGEYLEYLNETGQN